ncbi:MAG: hypothetical protein QGF53_07275, partial [Alphaproteobacteria bacterium]|nr:hypothetical protein [Alphaproteobacteria bacterium]
MNIEIWVQYVFDFLALLAILAAALNWHTMTNQVEGDDPVESVRKMAAMAKKGGSLTALGLVLFVCGEL